MNFNDNDQDSNYEVAEIELYHEFSITSQRSPKQCDVFSLSPEVKRSFKIPRKIKVSCFTN